MITAGEVIAKVRNDNKFLSKDNKLSDRYVLATAKNVAKRIIKQSNNLTKIYKSDEMFQYLYCQDLVKVDLSECCNVTTGCFIARTRNKIPTIETGFSGYLIQRVTPIDGGKDINPTTARDYQNIKNLKYSGNNLYYWIQNGYLYISDSEIEKVSISAFFSEYILDEGDCPNPYDRKFLCPEWLLDEVLQVLNKELQPLHSYRDDDVSDGQDKSR